MHTHTVTVRCCQCGHAQVCEATQELVDTPEALRFCLVLRINRCDRCQQWDWASETGNITIEPLARSE